MMIQELDDGFMIKQTMSNTAMREGYGLGIGRIDEQNLYFCMLACIGWCAMLWSVALGDRDLELGW